MPKKVFAFYYPWYGNPKHSGKWLKWDSGGHNPDNKISGLPDIASVDHPLIGAYDSSDETVIKKHLLMSAKAGIDALIVSVWVQKIHQTRSNFESMLEIADKINSKTKLAFYYEDLPNTFDAKKVAGHLIGLIKHYGAHKSFFRVNGKPFILIYTRVLMQLGISKWLVIRDLVKKATGAYLIVDSRYEEWIKNFDGAFRYTYLDALFNKRDMLKEYSSLKNLCDKHGKLCILTVMPGYDDSGVKNVPKEFVSELMEGAAKNFSFKRMFSLLAKFFKRLLSGDFQWLLITFGIKRFARVSREDSFIYKKCWSAALKLKPDYVLITSFNEWHEGTEIEPSKEYGSVYLKLTKEFVKEFKK